MKAVAIREAIRAVPAIQEIVEVETVVVILEEAVKTENARPVTRRQWYTK